MSHQQDNCRYCNGKLPLFNDETGRHINGNVFVEGNVLNYAELWDTYNDKPSHYETNIKINFCPMCGRKLQ